MVIPGWIAQWSTAATFLGSVLGMAFVLYQWRNHVRKQQSEHDELVEIRASRQAKTEFMVEDHEEKLKDHEQRIGKLERSE